LSFNSFFLFQIYRGQLHPEESIIEEVDIRRFLPENFTIRDPGLLAHPKVTLVQTNLGFLNTVAEACKDESEDESKDDKNQQATATIEKDGTEDTLEEQAYHRRVAKDIKGLFSQDCIQYIAARLFNSEPQDNSNFNAVNPSSGAGSGPPGKTYRTSSSKKKPSPHSHSSNTQDVNSQPEHTLTGQKRIRAPESPSIDLSVLHPIWDKVVNIIQLSTTDDPSVHCPTGLSLTRNELIATLAINMKNMQNSNLYYKLKTDLVRCLLRVSVRPISEAAYKSMKISKAKEKRQRLDTKKANPAKIKKSLVWKRKLLLLQLDQAIRNCSRSWSHDTLTLESPIVDPSDGDTKRRCVDRVSVVLVLIGNNEHSLSAIGKGQDQHLGMSELAEVVESGDDEEYEYMDEDDDDGFNEAAEEEEEEEKEEEKEEEEATKKGTVFEHSQHNPAKNVLMTVVDIIPFVNDSQEGRANVKESARFGGCHQQAHRRWWHLANGNH